MDLNDLLRDGQVSLDAFIEAAANETPIAVEATEEALAARGRQALVDLAASAPRDGDQAQELLAAVLTNHLVELGFAHRRAPGEIDALTFRIAAAMPRGAKGAVGKLSSAIRREGQRQAAQLRIRAVNKGQDGVDPAVWDRLPKTEAGAASSTFEAVCIVLESDPRWKGRLEHCLFRGRPILDGKPIETRDVLLSRRWLERVYGLRMGSRDLSQALAAVASGREYHPVRQYLDSVVWDGVPRLSGMLERYFGAELPSAAATNPDGSLAGRHALYAAYGRAWLISAVARVWDPGCKVDTLPVFAGSQGLFKSTAIKTLFGASWYRNSLINIGDKDTFVTLSGVWVYELAEFAPVSRRDHQTVRSFISSESDAFRPPYGEFTVDQPRQVVFVGTVNPEKGRGFLRDPTGDRRYWVVDVTTEADLAALAADRDQLWAEAMVAYRAGEHHWLSKDLEAERSEANDRHRETDLNAQAMQAVLDELDANTPPEREPRITVQRLLSDALSVPPDRARGQICNDAAAVLAAAGWRRARRNGTWLYVPSSRQFGPDT